MRHSPMSTLFPYTTLFRSENEQFFRLQQIRGDVHDPGAAMWGGVAGHAGLFSNAYDLAKLRSEEHTSELQSRENLVCRLLLEKKNNEIFSRTYTNLLPRAF